MKYWYQTPNISLSGYIRTVLVLEGFSPPGNSKLPLVTQGMPVLICKTGKDESGTEQVIEFTLFGKSTPAGRWEVQTNTTIIAFFFKPFMMSPLFNIAASEIVNRPVEISVWSPHKYNALKIQLAHAEKTLQKVDVLENLLLQELNQNKRNCDIVQHATDSIMLDPGTGSLAKVIQQLNLTEKTFQRIFKKHVGVTANQYRRVCQFQNSFSQVRSKDFDKLTDIAFENGFADQSHFNRAFKEFTKITPVHYLKDGLKPGE